MGSGRTFICQAPVNGSCGHHQGPTHPPPQEADIAGVAVVASCCVRLALVISISKIRKVLVLRLHVAATIAARMRLGCIVFGFGRRLGRRWTRGAWSWR